LAGLIDRLFQGIEKGATVPGGPRFRPDPEEPGPDPTVPDDEAPASAPPPPAAAAEVLALEVGAYLEGPEAGGVDRAARIEALCAGLAAAGGSAAVARAVERLALDSVEGDVGALDLARRLLTPEVARVLALDLGNAARDETRREGLTSTVSRLGRGMAAPIAAALAESSERAARRAYVDALTGLGEGALPVVREMVTDSRWFVVRNAMRVLRDTAGDDAIEDFTSALGHTDPRVRREALLSLAHVGGEAASLLVPSKIGDPDPEVREAAAKATGALRVERGVVPLLEQLDREQRLAVQEAILLALGQVRDPGAVAAIEKRAVPGLFSRRPPAAVRIAAYRALWAIGTPHARKLVGDAERDRDPGVRAAAKRIRQARDDH
jgi:HEAT repeat protein